MRVLAGLRGRVAALVVLAVALSLTVVGVVVVESFAAREHRTLDQRLDDRPARQTANALRRGAPLRDSELFARLSRAGRTLVERDVPDGVGPPSRAGLRTERAGGQEHRVRTRRLPAGPLVELGTSLERTNSRIAALRNRVILLSLAAVAVAGLAAWWLAGLALAPLAALRAGAARVSSTRDLSARLPTGGAGEEIDAVSGSLNDMLGRLERSAADTDEALAATRRFAADAGHEVRTPLTALRTNLAALARNPGLAEAEREQILREAEEDAARAARLLEALQLLARGDAGASLPREPVDLDALVDGAVDRARRRHPDTTFTRAGERAGTVAGWPDGVASIVDNLLDNAALHGGGTVTVAVRDTELTVDDDGPGIPEADRERLFDRFARGHTTAQGSGLGLALVRQQARLHGGDAQIRDRPGGGGTRMVVTFGAQATSDETTAS